MGWLAVFIYIGISALVWVNFGVWLGVLAAVVGAVVLNVVGPWLDDRFGDRSLQFMEFHEAWDSLVGPPQNVDALSAKRLWLSKWRGAWKESRISAYDWLIEELSETVPDEPK